MQNHKEILVISIDNYENWENNLRHIIERDKSEIRLKWMKLNGKWDEKPEEINIIELLNYIIWEEQNENKWNMIKMTHRK